MSKPKPPCLGCPDRHINCHSDCKRGYKEFVIANINYRKIIKQGRRNDAITRSYVIKAVADAKRRKNLSESIAWKNGN